MFNIQAWRVAYAAAFGLVGAALPSVASAEYRLAPGDVVEVGVASTPDLRQRARVNSEGEVSLAYLGQLKAVGRPISELRAEIRRLLPSAAIRRKVADRIGIIVIDPEEITVDVAEYRPIYMSGDVSKPGELVYRLGMTARQAVALAGGYDLLRFRADRDPIMQVADLRSEYETLWTEFGRAQVRIWRVQTELGSGSELTGKERELNQMPLPRSLRDHLLQNERERLAANTSTFNREEASLTRQMKQIEEQSALVAEQIDKTRQGVRLALAELERVQDLFQRGLAPANRLAEERRLALLQQTQSLQATERLGQVTREREELARRLDMLKEQRKATLTQELHEANMQLETARVRLLAAEEKLTYSGLLRSQLTRGKGTPDLIIHRITNGTDERITADEGTPLQPGDTVEVTLRTNPEIARPEAPERRAITSSPTGRRIN
jgi:polysaccharide export outer membrane protein